MRFVGCTPSFSKHEHIIIWISVYSLVTILHVLWWVIDVHGPGSGAGHCFGILITFAIAVGLNTAIYEDSSPEQTNQY